MGGASLAGRRWGPAISGWLVALPLTSAPVILFLALDQGPVFAAHAAAGTLVGTLSQTAFSLAYVRLAGGRRWPAAFGAASLAFAAATFAFSRISLPAMPLFAIVLAGLALGLGILRGSSTRSAPPPAGVPAWDLPARIVVATSFVLVLTAIAPLLGARLTGLLSPFPIFAGVLAAFAHAERGADAAAQVLRGLQAGLFGFAAFFFVLVLLLPTWGVAGAFAAATVGALALQALSLHLLRSGRWPMAARETVSTSR
jgi:hypothetical protein